MRIGIFDSGIGGEAIAAALQKAFPIADILVTNDRDHLPYGDKTQEELIELTDTAIQPLLRATCDCIVIACNSATAAAIEWLRLNYPSQKFIGIEPMIKPAASQTKTGVIAICATPATLRSERYKKLVHEYAASLSIVEPDCSGWAQMIEDNSLNEQQITVTIEDCLAKNADVIILGCTHYHWIKDLIEKIVDGRATVLEPSEAIARRVQSLLTTRSPQQ